MAAITVTYSFTNSTVADATQVNTNFTDIINGTSDGTKDFSISALTCAGTVTLNGSTTIGNSSSDDITITASLASTISIKTTTLYDVGSTTIGLRALYLGDAGSAARCTKILGATISAGWTLTLPTSGGTNKYVFTTDGSGTTSWTSKTVWNYVSKAFADSPYTALSTDDLIVCDTSGGAITINLPAAASNAGKSLRIKKGPAANFSKVTIDGNASETIDGNATRSLTFPNEAITIFCDGSNWHIEQRLLPRAWTAFTPTGAWSSNTTYTGLMMPLGGNVVRFQYKVAVSGAPTSAPLTLNIPNSWNVSEASLVIGAETGLAEKVVFPSNGGAQDFSAGTIDFLTTEYRGTTTLFFVRVLRSSGTYLDATNVSEAIPFTFAASDNLELTVDIPISELDQ